MANISLGPEAGRVSLIIALHVHTKMSNKLRKYFLPWLLRLIIVILIIWQAKELMTRPIHCDEAEHAHVAYRIAEGEMPFRDFFEHHCPGLWYLLVPFFYAGGYGAEVMYWGRLLSICSLLIITSLIYLLGRYLGAPLTGEMSAIIFLPFGIANQYILVRPDMLMLPLSLGGVYMAVRFIDNPPRAGYLFLAFGLVGLSLFFSLRSAMIMSWLLMIYGMNFFKLNRLQRITILGTGCIGPFLLLATTGFYNLYWWICKFTVYCLPYFSLSHTLSYFYDQYVIAAGLVSAVFLVLYSKTIRVKYFLLLFVLTLLISILPFLRGIRSQAHSYALLSLFSSLILAQLITYLWSRRNIIPKATAVGVLLAWIPGAISGLKAPALMLSTSDGKTIITNSSTLREEIKEMDDFCKRYDGKGSALIVWDYDVMYVASKHNTYYSIMLPRMPESLQLAGIYHPVLNWFEDIRIFQPFVISENLIIEALNLKEADSDWWSWFNMNYVKIKRPRGDYLYWRRDIAVSPEDIEEVK